MKTLKHYLIGFPFLFALLLIEGCTKSNVDTSSLYAPTSADFTINATLPELQQQGRDLYINNCGRCHGLYSPDNYTPSQWKTILSRMAPNTNMSTTEIQLVTKYVSKGKQ